MFQLPFIERLSADELQRVSTIIRWGIWGFGIVTVVLTWAGHKVTDRIQIIQQIEKRSARQRQIAIEEDYERAKNRIADLEAKQRDRVLSPEQSSNLRNAMLKFFSQGSTAPFVIASKMNDGESANYARQILEALPIPEQARGFTPAGILPFQGIRIFSVGANAVVPGDMVKQAFQLAGIPFSQESFQTTACPVHPDSGVFIFVGSK